MKLASAGYECMLRLSMSILCLFKLTVRVYVCVCVCVFQQLVANVCVDILCVVSGANADRTPFCWCSGDVERSDRDMCVHHFVHCGLGVRPATGPRTCWWSGKSSTAARTVLLALVLLTSLLFILTKACWQRPDPLLLWGIQHLLCLYHNCCYWCC